MKSIVDFNQPASVPPGWRIADESEQPSNRVVGRIEITEATLATSLLDLSLIQKDGNIREIHQKLMPYTIYGAQLLDYLLANPHLFPETWKDGNPKYFMGTVYYDKGGHKKVRCIWYEGGGKWTEADHRCNGDYSQHEKIVVRPHGKVPEAKA